MMYYTILYYTFTLEKIRLSLGPVNVCGPFLNYVKGIKFSEIPT